MSVQLGVDRQTDGAGGSETVFLNFEICPLAAASVLKRLINDHLKGRVEVEAWAKDRIPRAVIS